MKNNITPGIKRKLVLAYYLLQRETAKPLVTHTDKQPFVGFPEKKLLPPIFGTPLFELVDHFSSSSIDDKDRTGILQSFSKPTKYLPTIVKDVRNHRIRRKNRMSSGTTNGCLEKSCIRSKYEIRGNAKRSGRDRLPLGARWSLDRVDISKPILSNSASDNDQRRRRANPSHTA